MLELKAMDFTYFHSHSYFLLFFQSLGLGFSMMSLSHCITMCHISVTVTQSHITIEEYRRFWKDDAIQHI